MVSFGSQIVSLRNKIDNLMSDKNLLNFKNLPFCLRNLQITR